MEWGSDSDYLSIKGRCPLKTGGIGDIWIICPKFVQ